MAGKGSVFKRGGVWWISYYANGKRERESAETTRKEQAQALLRERLQAAWEGRHFPKRGEAKQLTIRKLADDWLDERASKASIEHDRTRLEKAVAHFGATRIVAAITSADISAWRKHLKGEGYATATINRHLAVLRAALNLAVDRELLYRNPMRGVRLDAERNERDRLCPRGEYEQLRDEAVGDLRVVIVIGYWLGMRLGEIAGLTWERIDMQARTIRLAASATKEAAAKPLPIPAEAAAELEALVHNSNGRVFRHTVQTYSRMFGALCDELKIKDLRFHDLRHTAVTNMLEAGLDLRTIQAFTGHKTLLMVKRYAKVTETRLRDAMAQIESHATRGRDSSKR